MKDKLNKKVFEKLLKEKSLLNPPDLAKIYEIEYLLYKVINFELTIKQLKKILKGE